MPVQGLTDHDYGRIAAELRVEPEALMAVGHVESRDTAFYDDGFPIILFERHKFYKHARRDKRSEWSRMYPTICNPAPTPRGQYGSKSVQRVKFSQAFALDGDAAMMACSWGAFQELGENYDDYGFHFVGEFVDMMKSGIAGHLEIFVRSIRHRGLIDELQRHDWAGFARNYNGSGYRTFQYDAQMRNAYTVFKNKKINWPKVMAAFNDNEIARLTDSIGQTSTADDSAELQASPPNEPALNVELPTPAAVADPSRDAAAVTGGGEKIEQSSSGGQQSAGSGTQIAENIVNTGDKNVPDNFVPETKTVEAPAKEGSVTSSATMTIGGFVVPGFLVGLISAVKSWIAEGFVSSQQVGDTVIGFITNNQKYFFGLVGMVIMLLIVKKAFKQITLWVQMWIQSDPARHDVDVKKQ